MADESREQAAETHRVGAPKVNWDDSDMRNSYANVCNFSSAREEVAILFGTNQAWKGTEEEVTVQLSDQVILSPFAAKRLLLLLNNVVAQYEQRFEVLNVAPQVPPSSGEN